MMSDNNEKHPLLDEGPFYHGTKAELEIGDSLSPGFLSNFEENLKINHIYFSATIDAAVWGAELAQGNGKQHIYIVEPQGEFENDPNLTDKKFPGNPTRSYRSTYPLKIVGELDTWEGHPPEVLQKMLNHLDQLKEIGRSNIIN